MPPAVGEYGRRLLASPPPPGLQGKFCTADGCPKRPCQETSGLYYFLCPGGCELAVPGTDLATCYSTHCQLAFNCNGSQLVWLLCVDNQGDNVTYVRQGGATWNCTS
ncbi:hypothetical protein ABPG75_000433 [Micractinium tetrahymenae]